MASVNQRHLNRGNWLTLLKESFESRKFHQKYYIYYSSKYQLYSLKSSKEAPSGYARLKLDKIIAISKNLLSHPLDEESSLISQYVRGMGVISREKIDRKPILISKLIRLWQKLMNFKRRMGFSITADVANKLMPLSYVQKFQKPSSFVPNPHSVPNPNVPPTDQVPNESPKPNATAPQTASPPQQTSPSPKNDDIPKKTSTSDLSDKRRFKKRWKSRLSQIQVQDNRKEEPQLPKSSGFSEKSLEKKENNPKIIQSEAIQPEEKPAVTLKETQDSQPNRVKFSENFLKDIRKRGVYLRPSFDNRFPNEILLHIFSYLPPKEIIITIGDVSHLWRELSRDQGLFEIALDRLVASLLEKGKNYDWFLLETLLTRLKMNRSIIPYHFGQEFLDSNPEFVDLINSCKFNQELPKKEYLIPEIRRSLNSLGENGVSKLISPDLEKVEGTEVEDPLSIAEPITEKGYLQFKKLLQEFYVIKSLRSNSKFKRFFEKNQTKDPQELIRDIKEWVSYHSLKLLCLNLEKLIQNNFPSDWKKFEEKSSSTLHENFQILQNYFDCIMSLAPSKLKPEELKDMTVKITGEYLIYLPREIGKFTQLEKLDVSLNRIQTISPEIKLLSNLQVLNLGSNRLKRLPPEIGELSQLSKLYLSKNQLISLPSEIGNLSRLRSLYLSSNRLESLPSEIGKLSELINIGAEKNCLNSLPSTIGNLQKIVFINLSDNLIRSLPPRIGELQQLRELNLTNNRISLLPEEIGKLKIHDLHLNNNRLMTLPKEIGDLSSLRLLDLTHNHLTSLPLEIMHLSHLKILSVFNNSVTDISEETAQFFKKHEIKPFAPITSKRYTIKLEI